MEFAEVYLALALKDGSSLQGGNSQSEGHKGEIELFDWRWGLKMADKSPDARSSDRQAEGNRLTISKAVDGATVPMMSLLKSGETCSKATLTIKQRTEKEVELQVILKSVRLMSFDLNVQCGDMEVVLDEDWSLSYDEVEVRYKSEHGNKGQKVFALKMPPGIEQEEPAKLTASDSDGPALGKEHNLTKQEVIEIIAEYLKKNPQKK